jgi:hypothetical protein
MVLRRAGSRRGRAFNAAGSWASALSDISNIAALRERSV